MKIIMPKSTIIEDDLQRMTIEERIEFCGRICDKSEEKIAPGTAIPFCEKMVSSGHGAVLEMAVLHLAVGLPFEGKVQGKYLQVTQIADWKTVVTGSIRAFMEYDGYMSGNIRFFLSEHYPLFFGNAPCEHTGGIRFAREEEVPMANRHVAVKFITNRAVSHELVRHRPCSFLQEDQRYCRYSGPGFDGQVVFIRPWWFDGREGDLATASNLWMDSMQAAENSYLELLELGRSPQEARTVLPNSTKTEIIVYASLPEWWHVFKLRNTLAADPSMREVMHFLQIDFQERGWMN